MATSFRALCIAAALAALVSVRGDAQQQQPQPQTAQPQSPDQPPPPTFRTGINYVRVDVIVSDKTGQPVNDLKEGDFEVLEDGKPQAIDAFKLIKLDGGAAESAKEPAKPIRTDYDEESEAARDDVRLFGIFLDDYHVRKGTSLSVRNPLSRFIETQIGPSDMVGVMYPLETTSSVRFTRNHEAVMKAMQQFVGRKFDYTPQNQFEEQYANYPTETVEQIRNQVSLSAIKGLIIHMGTLKEGRKSLIVVSEGFTNALPPQMRNANAQMPGLGNPAAFDPSAGDPNDPNEVRYQAFAQFDMESDLRNVYDEANRQNVSIYAVDPRGLAAFEFDINENVGNFQTDQQYLRTTMDTLRTLAENTDGRAIVNRNDIEAGMKQIMRDSSAYYLIGYNSSQAPSDGKFHEIKVRVKRAGVQVRARKGYWALNNEEKARALAPPKLLTPKPVEKAIEDATIRPSRASVIRSWVGTSRGENGKTRVTFVWEPLPKSPGDSRAGAEEPSRVSLTAVNPDGSPSFRGKVPDGPPSPIKTPQRVTFDAPPGKLQLRVSVEGASSQVLDSETREIAIPDLTSPTTTIGTPEVLRARTIPELNKMKADPDAVPTAAREFLRSDRLVVRVPVYGPGNSTPAVSVHLLNRAGQAMNQQLTLVASPKPGEQQLDLPVAGLPNGEYVLEIKASGDGGDATALVGFRVAG
ncbi:MAG TPA: VWA domain-containing protein [Vicinamibacterales bacterium]|nr:VWA domain-containing protein [Vicinamibacterales bacterium]